MSSSASARLLRVLDRGRSLVFSVLRRRTMGAAALAVDGDGRVLLVRHSYGSGEWMVPGGGVKRSEEYRQAVLRELREEVGLELSPSGTAELLGIYLKVRGGWRDHVAVFVVTGWTREPRPNWEIAEVAMFSVDGLPSPLSGAARRRLEEWQGIRAVSSDW